MLVGPLPPQHSSHGWSFEVLDHEEEDDDDIQILDMRFGTNSRPALNVTTPRHETIQDRQADAQRPQKRKSSFEQSVREAEQPATKKTKQESMRTHLASRTGEPGLDRASKGVNEIKAPHRMKQLPAMDYQKQTKALKSNDTPGVSQFKRIQRAERTLTPVHKEQTTSAVGSAPEKALLFSNLRSTASKPSSSSAQDQDSSRTPSANQSVPSTVSKASPTSLQGTLRMPFLLDDSSDDERPPAATNSIQQSKLVQVPPVRDSTVHDATQREAQRLKSNRLREEAMARRGCSTQPASVQHIVEKADVMNRDSLKRSLSPSSFDFRKLKEEESVDTKSQVAATSGLQTVVSKIDSSQPYTTADHKLGHSKTERKVDIIDEKPNTGSNISQGLGTKSAHPDTAHVSNSQVSAHGSKPLPKDVEAERLRRLREQNSRKRNESLQAQMKAISQAERTNGQERTIAEVKKKEGPHKAEEQPGLGAVKRAELDPKGHSQPRKEAEKRQAHASQREAEARARKGADAIREADARQRNHEKRLEEESRWLEAQKVRESQRHVLEKRAEEAKKESNAIAQREGALARLTQVTKDRDKTKLESLELPTQRTKPPGEVNNNGTSSLSKPAGNWIEKRSLLSSVDASNNIKDSSAPPKSGQPGLTHADPSTAASQARSAVKSDADTIREQRIQATKERNARMHRAEEVQDSEDHGKKEATPATQPLPNAPVSLNSAAGQTLLANFDRPIRQPQPGAPCHPDKDERRGHARKLGEILFEDIALLQWRASGMSLSEIEVRLERRFKYKRAVSTLRSREKQVRDAILAAQVGTELLSRADAGNEEARQEVNKKVHGSRPGPPQTSVGQQPNSPGGHPVARNTPVFGLSANVDDVKQLSFSSTSSDESKTLFGSAAPSPSQDYAHLQERPQTSGKSINEDYFRYHLDVLAEEALQISCEGEESDGDDSSVNEEDYCHFAYQVERREISQDNIECGESIDDEVWLICSEPLGNVTDANVAATKQLFRVPKGMESAVDLYHGREHKVDTLEGGMESHELTGKEGGLRQVRVTRFMRTHQDGILPRTKEGWAPRTVYFVKKRTVTKSGDDIFETSNKSSVEENANNMVYTTLDLANTNAVKLFVELTFTPESRHLTRRQLEIQEIERQLMTQLDDEMNDMFQKGAESEDGAEVINVWVEEGQLAGPRNLY